LVTTVSGRRAGVAAISRARRWVVVPAERAMALPGSAGQLGDVPPDRHVGDVEAGHEVRDPDGAVAADLGEDQVLALLGEHLHSIHHDRTEVDITAG
jgi:hypothetical protein